MSMGHSANYADVVTEDFIKEILEKAGEPDLLDKFYETFPDGISESDIYDGFSALQEYRFQWLVDVFNRYTGLELYVGYHDSQENGDRYDEVDGVFWGVGGVYRHTEAGEKYKDQISRCFYVTFG